MTKLIFGAAFAAGLATVGWVAAGYLTGIAGHLLALAITLLIAACYLAGVWELRRHAQTTTALAGALHALQAPPASLDGWLATVPTGLRHAVRQRIEGARQGLPGPALASYLTGLLVLLGMLGTFLGMVVTLHGTGAALLGAQGLDAIRNALSAPVQGLGLAFGTSVAGVAASAALGLMAALVRRDRLQAAQLLDAALTTTLRPFTPQHQREASLRIMEQQAALMPALVERIGACMAALEQQQTALNERLAADQARFHQGTEAAYGQLAASVERTLTSAAAESARQAGAAIQPAVEAALAGLARESAQLQAAQAQQVRSQLSGMADQLGQATAAVATQWASALATHQHTSEATTRALGEALAQFTTRFEERSNALADGLAQQMAQQAQTLSTQWGESLAHQARSSEQLAAQHQQALQAAAQGFAQHAAGLQRGVEQAHADLQTRMAAQDEARRAAWAASLQELAGRLHAEWQQASAQATGQWQQLGDLLGRTGADIGTQAEAQAARLLALIDQRAAQDEARQAAWTQSLHTLGATLQDQWQQAGTQAAAQWQGLGDTLARTAEGITRELQAQAHGTLGEIGTLVQAASEAPRAAAEVVGELRQKLSDSMVRDNAMLEERSRILQTLSTLLDAVNHASVEQRSAIDALVATTAGLMESANDRFAQTLDAQAERIDTVAVQLTSSAVEVASLGEAFGAGVQRFGEVNEQLMAQLQRIEAALGQSLARSDEQLDYYVAQAREVIELSVGAQKHIIDELQQLARERTA